MCLDTFMKRQRHDACIISRVPQQLCVTYGAEPHVRASLGSSSTRRAHPTGIGGDPGRSEKGAEFGQIRANSGSRPRKARFGRKGSFLPKFDDFRPLMRGQKSTRIRSKKHENSTNFREFREFPKKLEIRPFSDPPEKYLAEPSERGGA